MVFDTGSRGLLGAPSQGASADRAAKIAGKSPTTRGPSMTNERPFPKWGIYAATWFCAALSAIMIIGTLVLYATTGGPNPSMFLVFLFNLPLAFMAAAYPVKL